MQAQTDVQRRYEAALNALVDKLERDRYVLAAVLYGSLARAEAWEKSDIDLFIIQQDGLGRDSQSLWLVEDGINIWAEVFSRGRFKRMMEGALQGSIVHSIRSHCSLLFSKDPSIEAWIAESDRIGARDQEFQLLRVTATVPYLLDKAEKWLYVKDDPYYSFLWIMHVVNSLARVEVVLNGEAPAREVIHQALRYNPTFFDAVYRALIDGPKDRPAIQSALDKINRYLEERADRLFKPVLDALGESDGMRTASDLNTYFRKKVQTGDLVAVYEWLAGKGIIEKIAAPVRLTRKSQIALEEPAYYYDADMPD